MGSSLVKCYMAACVLALHCINMTNHETSEGYQLCCQLVQDVLSARSTSCTTSYKYSHQKNTCAEVAVGKGV
eukprot:673993-Amphidinium_carterae.1